MCGVVIETRSIKASRKRRRCDGCGDIIEIGQGAERTCGADGGDFWASYWCLPCVEFLREHYDDMREGGYIEDDGCFMSFSYPIAEYRDEMNPEQEEGEAA